MVDYFFFFKQKTAYEMRISDWSSDVCSSDLVDNNFYTNRMARAHLRDAVAVWHRLAAQRPADHARLATALALDAAQVQQWQRAADAMYLPFDAARAAELRVGKECVSTRRAGGSP